MCSFLESDALSASSGVATHQMKASRLKSMAECTAGHEAEIMSYSNRIELRWFSTCGNAAADRKLRQTNACALSLFHCICSCTGSAVSAVAGPGRASIRTRP